MHDRIPQAQKRLRAKKAYSSLFFSRNWLNFLKYPTAMHNQYQDRQVSQCVDSGHDKWAHDKKFFKI